METRRSFIGKTAVAAGVAAIGGGRLFGRPVAHRATQSETPREVWLATVSQHGLRAETPSQMAQLIIDILAKSVAYRPDIVCLPEVFMTTYVSKKMTLSEKADISDELLQEFSGYARQHRCYLICPTYTRENGKTYNSAIIFDREGGRMGEFRKIHLPDEELELGLTPGPLHPPVFKTDFGTIGVQICYDLNWNDGWKSLREQGAEIIFWPSAFAGGRAINTKAWQNKVVVVSSTNKDTSKICDITGETVAQTGVWDRHLICAPVNLEKTFLHAWPFVRSFDDIRAKYGRKVRITNYHEEEWTVIESLSADVRVKDVLTEFKIRTHEELMRDSTVKNANARG